MRRAFPFRGGACGIRKREGMGCVINSYRKRQKELVGGKTISLARYPIGFIGLRNNHLLELEPPEPLPALEPVEPEPLLPWEELELLPPEVEAPSLAPLVCIPPLDCPVRPAC